VVKHTIIESSASARITVVALHPVVIVFIFSQGKHYGIDNQGWERGSRLGKRDFSKGDDKDMRR
jgi:hypothetical protein